MPVIKSVFKNVRSSERKRLVNLKTKESFKGKVKEVKQLVAAKKMSEAQAAAFKALDMAAKKNVISANSAARKKSNLARSIAPTKEAKAKK
jgi:small subunit ribosomal protein S20